MEHTVQSYTAFNNQHILIQGSLEKVVLKVKKQLEQHPSSDVLIFSDSSGKKMDFDLRGSENEVLARLEKFIGKDALSTTSGPGRPKLGVISREVSLLPRHWEWLSTQSGGASASLRRLIDETKKQTSAREIIKQAQERTYKFMTTIAGNLSNYEDALRALFSKDKKLFEDHINDWPKDIKKQTIKLAGDVFAK